MDRNTLLLILLFIFVCVDMIMSYSSRCNDGETRSVLLQLKRHLLCEYDSEVRPVQTNNNVTRVKLHIIPQFLDYNSEEEIFELHTWTSMTWNDSHLTWDPVHFDNIQLIFMSAYEIWLPDIYLHNVNMEDSVFLAFTQTKCWVWKKGRVQWLTPMKYSTYCIADNTWWPYNIMNCSIQFGSWSYSGDEIDLDHYPNLITTADLHEYQTNVEWDLLKFYITSREETHKFNSNITSRLLSYHFILKRHWGIIRIAYVTPSIVLMVLTLTTLWLESKSPERMIIANLNFICHLLCMSNVHWEMPKSGFNVPKLLTFYESSFALASFVLILTNILRQLQELTTAPPLWISAATTSLLRSRVGQILLISILDPAVTAKIEADADDNADLVQSNSKKSPWSYVIVIVSWLAFSSVLFSYIVLLATCMPTLN
ncbi:PREDICTED: neuronal acetylcholine receptor subunit alpha-2-like [Dinoponera quadriceps]|uniref:Neuronal acetylcholine receptor subunit alpha-2-like n=1 Tax=Dinoponera quadriceps TaxID=609295 RepID=A0A6P3XGK3_DINQU|nr:PREDICTED: neuronal acetylcholine receptor subunit alpha-2-like [Dinoponera quadriceps]